MSFRIINQLREDCSKSCVIVRGVPPGFDPQILLPFKRAQKKDESLWLVMFHNEEQANFYVIAGSCNIGNIALQFTASSGSDIPDDWLQDESGSSDGAEISEYPLYPTQGIPGQPSMPQPPNFARLPSSPKKPPAVHNVMTATGTDLSHMMDSIYKSSDWESIRITMQKEPPEETKSIKVSSLPTTSVNEDFITDFFTRQKHGGGDVAEVNYNRKNNTAIVTFEESKVVKRVLQRHEFSALKMNNAEIQIEEYFTQSDESDGKIEVSAILVTHISPSPKVTGEQIELFFEDKMKSGGGEVQRVEYNSDANSAIVWFKDSEVVPKVLEKHRASPLMINKQKVEVEEYHPPQDESGASSDEDKEAGAIKVSKLPPGTTEEAITLFFENRKKSGGGEVEKVEIDETNHSAVVWFKETDAVSRVLQKIPLLFKKKQIKVEEVRLDGQKVEKEEKVSQGPLRTIEVRGMKETTSKDCVEFYFESRRSGGGEVEEVKGEVEGVLFVTFVDEKTVESVLQRTHKLEGATLQVKLYEPTKPIPMYPNIILIKNLNPETTKEGIINYFEAKSGDDVRDVVFGQEEGTALVTFEELTDVSKLENACQKKPLEYHYLSIKRVPVSNCIRVSGYSENTTESTMENYFDNERKSGGKDVKDVKFNDEDNTFLVYFEDHTVCDKVCKRSHVVDKHNLTVNIHHACLRQPFNPGKVPRSQNP